MMKYTRRSFYLSSEGIGSDPGQQTVVNAAERDA